MNHAILCSPVDEKCSLGFGPNFRAQRLHTKEYHPKDERHPAHHKSAPGHRPCCRKRKETNQVHLNNRGCKPQECDNGSVDDHTTVSRTCGSASVSITSGALANTKDSDHNGTSCSCFHLRGEIL